MGVTNSKPTKLLESQSCVSIKAEILFVLQEPVIDTSLDDAFASMMQFMTISSRKCKVSTGHQCVPLLPHPSHSSFHFIVFLLSFQSIIVILYTKNTLI